MKIYIASDHGGFHLKNEIIQALNSADGTHNSEVTDLGPYEFDKDDDYPDYAKRVAEKIKADPEARGILICRSGNGMCIAANKFKGVYAALTFSEKHAEMAVVDDNANVLCLDADYENNDSLKIVISFLKAEFAGHDTRHGRRFRKIQAFENSN